MSKTQYELTAATHQWVRAIAPGIPIDTVLVVESASLKDARNGPFWMLDLKDATGSLSARVWSPLSQMFTDIPTGSLVAVEGKAERYREQIQCSVTALRVLDEEEAAGVDVSIFMPASARSPLIMLEELEAMADAVFAHEPWRLFVRRVLRDEDVRPRLLKASAARGIHHARAGGLLEHTLGVARLCMHFAELYPQLDKQALLAGAICHDLGKLWELTTGLSTEYTDEGRLAGHIFLGLERLKPHMDASGLEEPLRLHLQHLVLSHHGQYEYGSPRLPQTAEALALHYADNVDAKMDQCRSLFGDMEPHEAAWSPFQRSLERAVYRAPRTPASAGAEFVVPDEEPEPEGVCEGDEADFVQISEEDFIQISEDNFEAAFPQDDQPDLEPPAYLDDDPGPEDCNENLQEDCIGDLPDTLAEALPDEVLQEDSMAETAIQEAAPEPAPVPEPAPAPEAVVVAELSSDEHPKAKKSRLEARQCSLF